MHMYLLRVYTCAHTQVHAPVHVSMCAHVHVHVHEAVLTSAHLRVPSSGSGLHIDGGSSGDCKQSP